MTFFITWFLIFIVGGVIFMIVTPPASKFERDNALRDKWGQIK